MTLKPLLRLFLIKEINGQSNIRNDAAQLVAVNHNSHLDEFVVMVPMVTGSRRATHFFADKKHFFEGKFYFRLLAKRFQAIPIDRGTGNADKALRMGEKYLNDGDNVIIYPEGTRGHSNRLIRGKVGVAKLALWTGRPVIPIAVWGTHILMPKGVHKPTIKKIVKVNIGEPMTFEEYRGRADDPQALREVTDMIMTRIGELLDQEYDPEFRG
ncbi:MAG: 1-acyl-sn-glycerol-3-phosphate acyltransferase [Thermoplasmata archaeon]|nr:1-acyl-sn-glycerol-3-phosphate acyltransferase [Thermoplasmata archaeon]